jgi:hypothetical protein
MVVWLVRDFVVFASKALSKGRQPSNAAATSYQVYALRALVLIASVSVSGCSQMSPVVPQESSSIIVIESVKPALTPSSVPVPTPAPTTLAPKDIRLRVVRSMTTVRRKCWDQGEKYLPVCGVVYVVKVIANAKTNGTVTITWDAKLSTYDSCCGDRTLNTYFRRMNAPKVLSGNVDLTRVSDWDGYYMERSPSISNHNIPTGLTDGTFAHLTFEEGAIATVTFSIVFDNGGGGYMSWPYPLKLRVLGDGRLLASFTQDAKD